MGVFMTERRREGLLLIGLVREEIDVEVLVRTMGVVVPEGIAYTHRADKDFDIYFLSNQTDQEQTFSPIFRHKNAKTTIYNPLTDENYPYEGTISLPPYGSLFVCMGHVFYSHGGNKTVPRWE